MIRALLILLVTYLHSAAQNTDRSNTTMTVRKSAPSVSVELEKMNVLYIGVDNPVHITVNGYGKIKVSFQNEILTEENGGYIIRPRFGTEGVLTISTPAGKEISNKRYRIKRIPDPYAFIQGKRGDITMRKVELLVAGGIVPKMENFDFELPLSIVGFSVSVNFKGNIIEHKTEGNRFSENMLNTFSSLTSGSKVYIEDIKAAMPDGTLRLLPGINIRVVN